MDRQIFRNINQILARDNKSSTYKFALLRGTIELIEENSPFMVIKDGRAHFPLDLLVDKWLVYYYPLVSVPQINSSTQLAFAGLLREVVDAYTLRGGYSAFYRDLKDDAAAFPALRKKVAAAITQMSVKYIGT